MMKSTIILIMLSLVWANLVAQDITISFQPKVSGTTIDSIWVTNLRTNEKVKLLGSETLTLRKVTGVYSLPSLPENRHIYPNPCNGSAVLCFSTSLNQEVEVRVYNISGQLLNAYRQLLKHGQHRFNISFPAAGIYNVSIQKGDGSFSMKALCFGPAVRNCRIEYRGSEYHNLTKSAVVDKILSYSQGDILYCSTFSGKNNTIITDSPMASIVYTVEFYGCIDPDNNSYPIVKIGTQWWMAENLKTTKYNHGTAIPLVTDNIAWFNLTIPGYCWYNNDQSTYGNTYGALYNWYTVNTGKLCPAGWHVPIDAEWTTLTTFLGGESVAGGKMKETGTVHWLSPNTGATNESGFSGLPGGFRHHDSTFLGIGGMGLWWSSAENFTTSAWARYLGCLGTGVGHGYDTKNYGFSIRCVRD